MRKIIRSLFDSSRREEAADEMARRQAEEHAIAMQAAELRVHTAQFQAQATARLSERAAQTLLRRLQEDINGLG